ncbi:hypothetical protein [Paramuribaculum intestinale]|uniref:hypothetical protein n=1 Tax=Paramuribaculum intestinale TaxID=2094151 RepID=UPI00261C9EE1|nr:hypothetical protein [Paramuribaculum intestinale]
MKSRFRLNLMPETIEESLIYCLNSLGCERGDYLVDTPDYHSMLMILSQKLTGANPKCGLLLSGQFGTGKTTFMFALRKLFHLLNSHPNAWTYQEIDSLESLYLRAEDLRFPIVSYEKFLEAASAPILFLDNLGIELDGSKDNLAIELIKNLIRLRYDLRMQTVISTPFDWESIREIYGTQIASIMKDGYSAVEFNWMPFRK